MLKNSQLTQLRIQCNFNELLKTSLNPSVPELRCLVILEVSKLFHKSANLHDNPENLLRSELEMHHEVLNRLVVLENGVEVLLLKNLPVFAQIILVVRVKKKHETLNV